MIFLLLVFGSIVGSFLNMLIYRLPLAGLSIINPRRSFCPNCKTTLKTTDLLPIISFILLSGKCKYCHKNIKKSYLIVELIASFGSALLFYIIGLNLELVYFLLLFYALIVLFVIDSRHQILPDSITMPVLWLGILYNLQFGNLQNSILGAVFGYLSLWLVFWIFKIVRNKQGLGYGDFKLLALFGAWFGWQILPNTMLIASMLGMVFYLIKIKDKNQHFAFAPMMIIALLLSLLLKHKIIEFLF